MWCFPSFHLSTNLDHLTGQNIVHLTGQKIGQPIGHVTKLSTNTHDLATNFSLRFTYLHFSRGVSMPLFPRSSSSFPLFSMTEMFPFYWSRQVFQPETSLFITNRPGQFILATILSRSKENIHEPNSNLVLTSTRLHHQQTFHPNRNIKSYEEFHPVVNPPDFSVQLQFSQVIFVFC